MKIKFCGAAHMVLGSCYYVTTKNYKFLVDCGMFQGPKIEHYNYEKFGFDPKELDFVILTHTHIDHSGLLPRLEREGFKGNLYCTTVSARLCELLLLDSAKIQESNLRKFNEIRQEGSDAMVPNANETMPVAEFMYDTNDAMSLLSRIKTFEYGESLELGDDLKVKFVDAGHILGAASLQMTITEDGKVKRVLFSGDLGQRGQALLSFFAPADGFKPDAIIMEGTYGNKLHENRTDTVNKLLDIIRETTSGGNNVIIPSFAAQRTQELLFEIKKAKMFGKLPNNLEVYVDSPLASKITDVYQKSWKYLNTETRMFFEYQDNAFKSPNLFFTRNSKDSMYLNKKRGVVIISGSGMCNGGRILHHLKFNLDNPNVRVILVGYQAEETLGRELSEGAKEVMIDGKPYKVNAKVERLFGFSAHADQSGLMEFLKQYHFETLSKIFIVHADIEQAKGLQAKILEYDPNLNVSYPNMQEEFTL